MTDYQNELVMEHLDLVNWVIRTRISVPNRPLLTYDDFYAIGCEAICRAALKYQADMIPELIPLSITSCADIKSMCHFARRAGSMISSSALQSKMASVSISDICVPKVRSALKKSLIVCTS